MNLLIKPIPLKEIPITSESVPISVITEVTAQNIAQCGYYKDRLEAWQEWYLQQGVSK